MAVGVVRPAKSSLFTTDSSLPPLPAGNDMSLHPPDHSPDAATPMPDATLTQPPVSHLEFRNTLAGQDQHSHSPSPSHLLSSKKRRTSRSKAPGELRRSTSTPHMRNMALGVSGDLSPTSSKARNKLGYHRTSVACGHCRRRKIRCLLAPDDPQGRCANCIRLKKECNFYPVEHVDLQRSDMAASKDSTTGTPNTSAATSPHHSVPVSGDKLPEFRTPFPATVPATRNTPYGFQAETDIDPHHSPIVGGVPSQQPSYSYPHPIETQWPPATSFLPSSTMVESPSSSTPYWRQSPPTANSVYGSESAVSGAHTPTAMSTSSTMSYNQQDTHAWIQQSPFQPPVRSMSYGNIEGLPHQYPGQGLGIQQHDFARRSVPFPYPTTLDTASSTIHASTIGSVTSAPLSAPIVPNHQFYPPTWTSYEGVQSQMSPMSMAGRSMSAQWYAESDHLDQVQEEGAPSMSFNQHGMQQYYSGA